MMGGSDQTVKYNLSKSKDDFFVSDTENLKQERSGKPILIERLYVYYVDNIISDQTRHLKLKRLIFDKSPGIKKVPPNEGHIFFEKNISVDDVQKIDTKYYTGVLGRVFTSLKEKVESKIEKDILRGYKLKGEWPFYLSKMDYGLQWLIYCHKTEPKCPLVERYF
jgi:hypothetical protein